MTANNDHFRQVFEFTVQFPLIRLLFLSMPGLPLCFLYVSYCIHIYSWELTRAWSDKS